MVERDFDQRARAVLARYPETLLRETAVRLIRPRTIIPIDEMVDRCLSVLTNPPVVDRRIADLPEGTRRLLGVLASRRRPVWKVGHLLAVAAALGHSEGLEPILKLLEQGLLFPDLPEATPIPADFTSWLGTDSLGIVHAQVFTHPSVAARAKLEAFGLPSPETTPASGTPRAADGLDWPLRLAAVWQQTDDAPVRLTQSGALFKRDSTRLQTDPVLGSLPSEALATIADPGILALYLAQEAGYLRLEEGALVAVPWGETPPESWTTSLAECWDALTAVECWDPLLGYAPRADGSLSPFPSAVLLTALLLAAAKPGSWVAVTTLAERLHSSHPSWQAALTREEWKEGGVNWVESFLLGVMFPLRMVETLRDGERNLVRLSELGRHLVALGAAPAEPPPFPKTLLVQPNGEIVVYRQGLTPGLLAKLSVCARWKGIGPAGLLELTPERTYRALESRMNLAGILRILNQHGMKTVPPVVEDLLRRWADKRERIMFFTSATLVEFQTAADLETAIARGIVSIRVAERIGVLDDGRDPEFKALRSIGNRDYDSKPRRCLSVAEDGVTLTVDTSQSDLLLEAEVGHLSDPVSGDPAGLRRLRLSRESLVRAEKAGWNRERLDRWFEERTGAPLTPAGCWLLYGPSRAGPKVEMLMVLRFAETEDADGVAQWPETAQLFEERLGPKVFSIRSENLLPLQQLLATLGITLQDFPLHAGKNGVDLG